MSKSNFFGPGAYEELNGTTAHLTSPFAKPSSLGHRVGDGALEALAVGGVVVLEVGREGRLVGANRQLPGGRQRELILRAGRRLLSPAGSRHRPRRRPIRRPPAPPGRPRPGRARAACGSEACAPKYLSGSLAPAPFVRSASTCRRRAAPRRSFRSHSIHCSGVSFGRHGRPPAPSRPLSPSPISAARRWVGRRRYTAASPSRPRRRDGLGDTASAPSTYYQVVDRPSTIGLSAPASIVIGVVL